MKNKILKTIIITFISVNIMGTNAFAVTETCNAGDVKDPSVDDTIPTPSENQTPFWGGSIISYKPGSVDYPAKIYHYTIYNQYIMSRYSNFCDNTTNGRVIDLDSRGLINKYSVETDDGNYWYKELYSAVVFSKNTDNKFRENRVTDYYTWSAEGPVNWTVQGVQYQTVTFTMPGKYTVTSVPHQVINTTKWSETTEKAYDLFGDGHTKIIKNKFYESPKTTEKTEKNRIDLMRTWHFEITPEEVDKPIKIPDFIPVESEEEEKIDVDVELIE